MNTKPPVRVLIVDDDSDELELLERAFQRLPYPIEILVARDGPAALAHLLPPLHNRPLDLVLLDLKIPRVGGLEVLRLTFENPCSRVTPKVVMSSYMEPSILQDCYRSGASAVVRKPIDHEDLERMVSAIGAFWFGSNVIPDRC